jgi:two-component system OmpR family response regulator/two-component system response regulator QseB
MRVLIVEDDPDIASGLHAALKQHGCAVDAASNLHQAWLALSMEPFDAVLLDLGLPDGDGLTLLHRLRRAPPNGSQRATPSLPHPATPVIIMTARDAVTDRINGLDTGADDYLVKPFDVQELMARLRAALRRATGRANPMIEYGPLCIDPATHTATLHGQAVALGVREFGLLLTLLNAKGQVLDRKRLEAALYGFNESLDSNAIEVHIHHLRRKLGEGYIKTLRGVGYFVPRDPPEPTPTHPPPSAPGHTED